MAHPKNKFYLIIALTSIICLIAYSSLANDLAPPRSFTIATQNLLHSLEDYEVRKNNLIKRLKLFKPDIVVFQETWKHIFGLSLYKVFLKETGYNQSFCKTAEYILMSEGMGVASKYKQEKKCIELPYSKLFAQRYMIISTISIEDQEISVLNVHLSPWNDEERFAQLFFIADYIENNLLAQNVILLGDFNMESFHPYFFSPLVLLGFSNVDNDVNHLCTYCMESPYNEATRSRKIDYIFYRKTDLELIDFGKWSETLPVSDHSGLWAKFSIP